MANEEHVERLKRSVEEWNLWRRENSEIRPDLSDADLRSAHLGGADLSGGNLCRVKLYLTNLQMAQLIKADLRSADLSGTDLGAANLMGADLTGANLTGANLSDAAFIRADLYSGGKLRKDPSRMGTYYMMSYLEGVDSIRDYLYGANLTQAKLVEADLGGANLSMANLSDADLTKTHFLHTTFARVDLNNVKGLGTARHNGPSRVDINSVTLPYDEPTRLHFLRGVGFTETQIEYLPSLLMPRPIQYHSLFISYASQDEVIAKQLHTDLREKDIPCWFAPHDMKIGDKIRPRIDEAIHHHEKLLLILSEHSVVSQWVEHEVETALSKEYEGQPSVLFPIRLDDAVMKSKTGWASHVRLTRHIGDFTNWQEEAAYQEAFSRLLRDLKVSKPTL